MITLNVAFKEFIHQHRLVSPRQAVLLSVSGGIDSMVLLDLFVQLRERWKLRLSVIHINHQLRGKESMEDERFVQEMSASYGVPFCCEQVETEFYAHKYKLSKQVAARQLRYECFERIRRKLKAQVVATAHHADDNAETVLLNIVRGTGIHGLAGIPLKRETGHIIRPLLFATRAEIAAYATEQNIKFRNDSSNQSLMYRRNLLRHKIIPELQKQVPNIIITLNQIAATMRTVDDQLRVLVKKSMTSLVRTDTNRNLVLNVNTLESTQDFLRNEIFVELLNRLHIEPTEKKVDSLDRIYRLPTGRVVKITSACAVYRNRDTIIFSKGNTRKAEIQQVEFGKKYDFNACSVSLSKPEPVPSVYAKTQSIEYVDADRLGKRIILRPWKSGDWFIPLGMKAKKKLSDFFINQKVPRYQKASIPVLESDGAIVWVCGKRLDDRFKLTKSTTSVIRLTYHQAT